MRGTGFRDRLVKRRRDVVRGYQVTVDNNYCRVFEVPSKMVKKDEYKEPVHVVFKLVDWFVPIRDVRIGIPRVLSCEFLEDAMLDVRSIVESRGYYQSSKEYIVVTNFGLSFNV